MKISRKTPYLMEPSMWVIPTVFYFILKTTGIQFAYFEWAWWIAIPALFIWWFTINWKIEK